MTPQKIIKALVIILISVTVGFFLNLLIAWSLFAYLTGNTSQVAYSLTILVALYLPILIATIVAVVATRKFSFKSKIAIIIITQLLSFALNYFYGIDGAVQDACYYWDGSFHPRADYWQCAATLIIGDIPFFLSPIWLLTLLFFGIKQFIKKHKK